MKDSNENHIFINEKLNKALKKSEERIEKLTSKIKTITNESVVLPKRSLNANNVNFGDGQAHQPAAKLVVENGPGVAAIDDFPHDGFAPADGEDDIFGGDVSSIMIKPD